MRKEELHVALMEHMAEYRSLHPRTLDIDMKISEALSKGDTITKVSINTPCDISTVYRSIIRKIVYIPQSWLNRVVEVKTDDSDLNELLSDILLQHTDVLKAKETLDSSD